MKKLNLDAGNYRNPQKVRVPEQSFKRNVAYKLRIGDLLVGKPVIEGDKFLFHELRRQKDCPGKSYLGM